MEKGAPGPHLLALRSVPRRRLLPPQQPQHLRDQRGVLLLLDRVRPVDRDEIAAGRVPQVVLRPGAAAALGPRPSPVALAHTRAAGRVSAGCCKADEVQRCSSLSPSCSSICPPPLPSLPLPPLSA